MNELKSEVVRIHLDWWGKCRTCKNWTGDRFERGLKSYACTICDLGKFTSEGHCDDWESYDADVAAAIEYASTRMKVDPHYGNVINGLEIAFIRAQDSGSSAGTALEVVTSIMNNIDQLRDEVTLCVGILKEHKETCTLCHLDTSAVKENKDNYMAIGLAVQHYCPEGEKLWTDVWKARQAFEDYVAFLTRRP